MRNRVSIKAIQAFEAAARLGSLALAAEELAVTPSAVSHQVRTLEEQLQVRLFERVHRAVILTEEGRSYAEEVSAAFARIDAATERLGRLGGSGILTVHVMPSLANQWLMPRLSKFAERHPGIDIRLKASVNPVDLAAGAVDMDIRYNAAAPPPGVVSIPFPKDTVVPLCSPALANGLKPIRRPEDLRHHTLIHSEINIVGWRDWAARHKGVALDLERGPRFDRSLMAISAAVDGLGICLDSMLLAQQEILSGRLVMPFGASKAFKVQGHSLLVLKSKADQPKLRAFRDWLLAELEETARWEQEIVSGAGRAAE
jgi:LysR family transcriptional regulator, glycine cleavage system transcriptional activator